MASQLAEANILAKQRIQRIVAAAVAGAWDRLQHYNREQIDQWLRAVLPVTAAANRQTVALTRAFVARAIGGRPQGTDPQAIIDGIRGGVTPAEVYTRPFITVWAALGRGVAWGDAVQQGLTRATQAAVTDVQLTFTHTLRAGGSFDGRIVGWERVPDSGACDFCRAAAGLVYKSGDLAPLHTGCGCGVEPLMAADLRSPISPPPDTFSGDGVTVAVRQHGELGPVLTNAADSFTSQADLAHSH